MSIWKLDYSQLSDRKIIEEFWFNSKEGDITDNLKVVDVSYFQ